MCWALELHLNCIRVKAVKGKENCKLKVRTVNLISICQYSIPQNSIEILIVRCRNVMNKQKVRLLLYIILFISFLVMSLDSIREQMC
jgi:hypothetical protein